LFSRFHYEMKVAGVKAICDSPIRLVHYDGFSTHRPIARESPLVESQLSGHGIDVSLIGFYTAGGCKVLGAPIADIIFP
jgi:hypothetical protein